MSSRLPIAELAFRAEVLTPLVTSGAKSTRAKDVLKRDGLRPQKLIPVLEYWLRALAAGSRPDLFGDAASLANLVHKCQSRVFGKAGGASPVGMRAHVNNFDTTRVKISSRFEVPAIKPGTSYDLVFQVFPPAEREPTIQRAMASWITFLLLGGVGARTRRGVGSIAATPAQELEPSLPWRLEADSLAMIARTYRETLSNARLAIGDGGPIESPADMTPPPVPALCDEGARLWLIGPGDGWWNQWSNARDALWKRVYGPYKKLHGDEWEDRNGNTHHGIGRPYPPKGDLPSTPSPLLLTIKRAYAPDNTPFYFGVVLAWRDSVHEHRSYFGPDDGLYSWHYLENFMLAVAGADLGVEQVPLTSLTDSGTELT